MRKLLCKAILGCLSFCYLNDTDAQNSSHYGGGLKLNLGDNPDQYIRFLLWNQVWARSNANNPGTMVKGKAESNTTDIGIRSARLLAYAQFNPRYMVVFHLGINNQSFINGGAPGTSGTGGNGVGKKPQIFFHEAYNEYALVPNKDKNGKKNFFTMSLGAGLHYWNGVSRISSASTLTYLTIDAPIFNWPVLENGDQFARQLGIYTKGTAGKLHYQLSANKPYATQNTPSVANVAVDNNDGKASYQGYLDYQFLDQESNFLPYRVGSYLGSKKVFNIGAGFYSEKNGTKYLDLNNDIQKHNITALGTDFFLDMPINASKTMALTAYGVYYHYDYGPNYIRSLGIMNLGSVDPDYPADKLAYDGVGNSRVLMGTGNMYYVQAGLLLPKFSENENSRVQPFAAYTLKNLKALNANGHYYDVGINYYIDAHNAKLTGQYSSRPLFSKETLKPNDRKGEFIIQFQIAI